MSSLPRSSSDHVGVVVYIKLKDLSCLDEFLRCFQPLLEHSTHREPGTVYYDLFIKDQKEAEGSKTESILLVLLEKYINEHAFRGVHCHSKVFQDFLSNSALLKEKGIIESITLETLSSVPSNTLPVSRQQDRESILVFCGSRAGKQQTYMEAGAELGSAIAARGWTLVYGGGTIGIMGSIARAVVANHGTVQSVIPTALRPKEVVGELLGEVFFTQTMGQRKSVMFQLAPKYVVVLPGGLGTFDELLEVLTLLQLNAYKPRVGLLNVNQFFVPFLALVKHLIAEGFVESEALRYFVVEDTVERLLDSLSTFEVPPTSTNLSWESKP